MIEKEQLAVLNNQLKDSQGQKGSDERQADLRVQIGLLENTVAAMEHQLHLLERRRAQLQRTAQRMAALDRSVRDGVRYSDDQVGTATRNVVGAAMRVLERDEALRSMLQSI